MRCSPTNGGCASCTATAPAGCARRCAKFFRTHPLVASVAPAADNEGGDGATIVELKD